MTRVVSNKTEDVFECARITLGKIHENSRKAWLTDRIKFRKYDQIGGKLIEIWLRDRDRAKIRFAFNL